MHRQRVKSEGLTTSRRHVLEDLKPFICPFDTCGVVHIRWGHYEDWKNHIEATLFLLNSPNWGVGGMCPLCTKTENNLITHLEQHLLDLLGVCVSIYRDVSSQRSISSTFVDHNSLATTEPNMIDEEIADHENLDLMTLDNCYTPAAPIANSGWKAHEWAFLGGRFASDNDVLSSIDSHRLTDVYKVPRVRRPEEPFSSSDEDPYREVLLAKQIEYLDDQVDIKGTFWPLSLSRACMKLKVHLRKWEGPCDTWELFEDMLIASDDDIAAREGFEVNILTRNE